MTYDRLGLFEGEVFDQSAQDQEPAHVKAGEKDWIAMLRAYLSEDWLTLGIAEHLESQADAPTEVQRLRCLGCGHRFPTEDLWVHKRWNDLAYCDDCYYARFGRRSPDPRPGKSEPPEGSGVT